MRPPAVLSTRMPQKPLARRLSDQTMEDDEVDHNQRECPQTQKIPSPEQEQGIDAQGDSARPHAAKLAPGRADSLQCRDQFIVVAVAIVGLFGHHALDHPDDTLRNIRIQVVHGRRSIGDVHGDDADRGRPQEGGPCTQHVKQRAAQRIDVGP